jgi:hypothetical protein
VVVRSNPTTGIAGCCARSDRPRDSRAAEQRDELAATDVDCHLTLPWKVMPMQWWDHITL